MLDRIVISSNRKEAHFIFDHRAPFVLTSDVDVVVFLMWFLDHPQARMIIKEDKVVGLEFIAFDDEITMKIEIKEEAA